MGPGRYQKHVQMSRTIMHIMNVTIDDKTVS